MQLIKSPGWAADGVREPVQELPADVRGRPRPQPLPREDPLDVRAEPLLARGRLQHPRRRVLSPRILPPRGAHRDAPGEGYLLTTYDTFNANSITSLHKISLTITPAFCESPFCARTAVLWL